MSVEKRYAWFVGAVLAVFAVFSAVIIILADGGRMCAGSGSEEPVYVEYIAPPALEFTESSCYMTRGSELALRLRPHDEVDEDTVIDWSSSDATVVRVDAEGKITALADGTVTVTASCRAGSAKVTVFVADDLLVAGAECVRTLSTGCDSGRLEEARKLISGLEQSELPDALKMRNLLQNIIAYIEGGDRAALDEAIKASGVDADRCRTAAICCWAYGERQRSDGVLTFVGDCTLARFNEMSGKGRFPHTYAASGSLTYPFDRVKGVFACDDVTVVNFEGTLTDYKSHQDKEFYFRGDPSYARILPASSIEAAGLANNHSMDYLKRGYNDTVMHLSTAGVTVIKSMEPVRIKAGEKQIPVVMLAANAGSGGYDKVRDELLEAVRLGKSEEAVVVVNLHWGTESTEKPSKWQKEAAHELIDSGADLIIGHHPHVMQGIEMYNGKYIAYSLGNFAFGGNMTVNSPQTCILRARLGFDEGGAPAVTGISVIPCLTTSTGTRANNYQPELCFGGEGDKVYSVLIERSGAIDGVTDIDRPDV